MGRPAASLCLLLIALLAAGPALSASGAPDAPSVVKRELIRESARLSDLGQAAARDALARAFEVPVTEADVVAALSRAMVENGSSEYVAGFEAIVASGPASAIPHGEPSDDAANLILPGEVVVVDIGARYKGWVSDNTKTYFMGPNPPEEFVEIYGVVKEAQTLASAAVQSGALARDLDSLARTFIDSKGYGEFFIHCLGHGVGLYVHVPPMLCPDSDDVLITARNDVVAVEPAGEQGPGHPAQHLAGVDGVGDPPGGAHRLDQRHRQRHERIEARGDQAGERHVGARGRGEGASGSLAGGSGTRLGDQPIPDLARPPRGRCPVD